MRYFLIRKMSISNGIGLGVDLFAAGCHFHCPYCFNKETWDFNGGKPWTEKIESQFIDLLDQPGISRVSILGGEPLEKCNLFDLSKLISNIKKTHPNIKIWVYTGWTYEELLKRIKKTNLRYLQYILENIDVLVDGQFVEEEKDLSYQFAGSRNQRRIDVPQTLKIGTVQEIEL